MKKWLVLLLCACVVLGLGLGKAQAVPYVKGDVFASTGNGTVKEFSPTGTLIQTLDNGLNTFYTTGSMFDAAGNFYVTTFGSAVVSKFDNNGNLVNASFMACGSADCESITRDKSGNAYVGHADGARQIRKYDIASGAFLASYSPTVGPRGTDWVDLAADQKTIYYTSEGGTIRRFDVSTNTQLADFANYGGLESYALRIRSDGSVLVAHTTDVLLIDSSGNVAKTYTFNHNGTLFALNLDPDGTSFWTGDLGGDNMVFRIDIATGNVLASFATNPLNGQLAGLAVFGEITQGGGGGQVPEPATIILLGSGLLGLAGYARKRMKK